MGLTEQEQKFWDTISDPNLGKPAATDDLVVTYYIKPYRPVEYINLNIRIDNLEIITENV